MFPEEEDKEIVSHEDVNNKLRQKELEESQKLVKFVADKFQSFGKIYIPKYLEGVQQLSGLAKKVTISKKSTFFLLSS